MQHAACYVTSTQHTSARENHPKSSAKVFAFQPSLGPDSTKHRSLRMETVESAAIGHHCVGSLPANGRNELARTDLVETRLRVASAFLAVRIHFVECGVCLSICK